MKNIISASRKPDIQLIITAALRKELPVGWLNTHNIPVHTLSALKSGVLNKHSEIQPGILVVITGVGIKESEEAACWIRDFLRPLFVVNIGTCGVTDKRRSLARWVKPEWVYSEDGDRIEIDTRCPFPVPGKTIPVHSLLSVKKAKLDQFPASWKKHDAVDMECFAQAQIFSNTGSSFHCLKFSTDYSDMNATADFNKNLETFRPGVKELFAPLILPIKKRAASGNPIEIAVVIPVFNREATIKRAIDSVLSQSYAPEDIIVVDDCSTDRTANLLAEYGNAITVIAFPANSGPSKARNEGINHAKTEWIAFLDSDDCWKPDKLKKQIEFLGKFPFYQILQSEEIWIRNGKRVNPRKHHAKPEGWIWEASLERCLVSPSGVLLRKSLLQKYRSFDECLPVCEDYDLWLKISRYHPVGLEPGLSVIKYGGHADQLSRKYPAMDSFRVQSLEGLLKQEEHPYYKKKIASILKVKLNILLQGHEKRGKIHEAGKCRKLLNTLNSYN
jgi:glycosyltransferase involved in cell wall biosynthesis/nucleoside phosphorylase